MSKEVRSLILVLGLPLVAAMLLAAGVAWRSLVPSVVHADGAGVDGRTGYAMTTIDAGGGVQYLCVSSYAPYMGDGQMRQFLSMYAIRRTGEGKGDLFFVGSRCVDFDRGFAEIGFKSPQGYGPKDLEREITKGRRSAASNEPPKPPAN